MIKKVLLLISAMWISFSLKSQNTPIDTIVVELSKTGKIVFTLEDPAELDQLEHYDYQALFEDIIANLRDEHDRDETSDEDMNDGEEDMDEDEGWDDEDEEDIDDEEDEGEVDDEEEGDEYDDNEDEDEDEEGDDYDGHRKMKYDFIGTTNFDFGIGSYISRSGFSVEQDAQYAVRPWGSWYVGVNTNIHTPLSHSSHIEWGAGFSLYNFKFQDDRTVVGEDSTGVFFTTETRDLTLCKSKLTVGYLNLSFVPVFEFGRYRDDDRHWNSYKRAFRIGAGVYGSYRLLSFTKQVYLEDNDRERERHFDDFYLNSIRYGVRFQFGVQDTDFFFNYDLNSLFVEDRGPKLNAYSFGITF